MKELINPLYKTQDQTKTIQAFSIANHKTGFY